MSKIIRGLKKQIINIFCFIKILQYISKKMSLIIYFYRYLVLNEILSINLEHLNYNWYKLL